MKPDERAFEDAIEHSVLTDGGYLASVPSHFNATVGLDTAELFAFIGATQAKSWDALLARYGNDPDKAQRGFVNRLAKDLDDRGTLDVLRHGVVDLGVEIRLSYFKPAHGLSPELVDHYNANRVTLTRQLPFEPSSAKTIDLCISINGIPVASAELKNPLSGQSIEHAVAQYRRDRDPRNVTLGRRCLVHFAVDPERVSMTTKLTGETTRFLPFNLGHEGHAGNPPNPDGHRSSYLWERVLARDSLLDLLARFVHVERPAKGTAAQKRAGEVVIFPRYHQWDAVLAIEKSAREHGAGQHYLIEHSAGSGKSNTIAWTAHRLSTLHDARDNKIFDKVIVITDRLVLDRQLQDTIYQFEHARGVVIKIDKDSSQLAAALRGEQARIIITTLQKFPFVLQHVDELPDRRYAVIVDEAHSSQTGEAAKELRLVLGGGEEQELSVAEAEDAGFVTQAEDPVEEALAKAVSARGRHSNLSFFAFTATPKARTLELFGTFDPGTKRFRPFHLYSMRQAIDEGFILDVLSNYTTYKTYWRIEKTVIEDPEYPLDKANRAIARFVALHPHNLSQKAEIIVEHFRAHVSHKIGGRAKAMVVTSSRLHAIRYFQAITGYVAKKGYSDVSALVAFSGKVLADSIVFSEHGLNGFPESETAQRFGTGDYQVLIVAEKFQTGFDQPLLHTMYVDKLLTNLNAVQTLSRLNRILPPLKTDTFVLDFRNETDDIVKAFEPYYGETVAPPSDPNLIYDTRRRLDDFDVLRPEEIEAAVALLVTMSGPKDHGRLYGILSPAVERFDAMGLNDRAEFKEALDRFVRTYGFLSQIVGFGDTKLERDYLYCRALASLVRTPADDGGIDLGSEVELSHLRNEVTFSGTITPEANDGEVRTIFGDGIGKRYEVPTEHLSTIIELLNERFGLELTEPDQLLFDQFEETWASDGELTAQARNNTIENFKLVFDPKFMATIVTRMDSNEAIFKQILDDPEFRDVLGEFYLRKMYDRLREEPGASG
ncbi:MAG: type I restriction endonuclease subunit R [Acidimicrobiales bacterium]